MEQIQLQQERIKIAGISADRLFYKNKCDFNERRWCRSNLKMKNVAMKLDVLCHRLRIRRIREARYLVKFPQERLARRLVRCLSDCTRHILGTWRVLSYKQISCRWGNTKENTKTLKNTISKVHKSAWGLPHNLP